MILFGRHDNLSKKRFLLFYFSDELRLLGHWLTVRVFNDLHLDFISLLFLLNLKMPHEKLKNY